MRELLNLTLCELEEWMRANDQPRFRAKQLYSWVISGTPFEEMHNLPKALRERLAEEWVVNPVEIREAYRSRLDETEKYLYQLPDGNLIEGVLMRYHHGDTLCLSTQVGCRMGCRFCASTLEGCVRNLTPGEMLGQIVAVNRRLREADRRVHNVVLMGSGEPLDNYENTVRFLRLLNAPEGLNLSLRNVSLSTCGLVPRMLQFAKEGLAVTLSISLHAPNDEVRKRLMPVANAYPIREVVAALRNYVEKTGRRVIVEYALVKGVNCAPGQADELAALLKGLICHVNLIPLNAVAERDLCPPDRREVEAFQHRLERRGLSATIRREMGADIQGACGQLRRSVLQAELHA